MASVKSAKERLPLSPVTQSINIPQVKQECESPGSRLRTQEDVLSTPPPKTGQGRIGLDPIISPPIFSMDALTDVLGEFGVGCGSQDDQTQLLGGQIVDQKFHLDDITTIQENADSIATALFNASQRQAALNASTTPVAGSSRACFPKNILAPSATSTLLPHLEHPLFESLLSPATSSRCLSPIYTRILMDSCADRVGADRHKAGGHDSSNAVSDQCSDSDFELDADSSSSSDNSSDSDFNMDSDSEYGRKGRRRGVKRRPGPKRWGTNRTFGNGGATRKQPYYHHKKNKDQVALLMGDDSKPQVRQINAHKVEAIAAAMGSSPVTVSWLLQNYETSEGNSLPRALMYGHYLRHCAELRLDPVNAASFGKLIRSVFVGLTTRRLGTRGNSKYHYCGIRIKDTSTLLLEDPDLSKKTRTNGKRSKKTQILAMQGVGICGLGGNKGLTLEVDSGGRIDYKSVKKYLGTRSANFPEVVVSEHFQPDAVSYQDLMYFTDVYKKHCFELMEAAELFKLHEIELLWHRFWQPLDNSNSTIGISKEGLVFLTKLPEVQDAVRSMSAFTFDQILSIMIPNVVSQLPFQLMEEYHKFSFSLRESLISALSSYEPVFVNQNLQLLDAFVSELKSWISLNLSAAAARDSMQSPNSIAQLLSDLNRINFRSVLVDVKEYVKVDEMDLNVHESLKRILSGPDSIEPWSVWLVGLVEQRLGMSSTVRAAVDENSTVNAVIKECQDLSLRWLKYMSQLKLELLLRSSGSLATFLSLELLFSNFLLHLIKVYKSRALQAPLVLYNIKRNNASYGQKNTCINKNDPPEASSSKSSRPAAKNTVSLSVVKVEAFYGEREPMAQ